jgi:hypothetical protein
MRLSVLIGERSEALPLRQLHWFLSTAPLGLDVPRTVRDLDTRSLTALKSGDEAAHSLLL